jgi:hypothetical protein
MLPSDNQTTGGLSRTTPFPISQTNGTHTADLTSSEGDLITSQTFGNPADWAWYQFLSYLDRATTLHLHMPLYGPRQQRPSV